MKKLTLFLLVVAAILAFVPAGRDEIHWRWSAFQDDAGSYGSYLDAWPDGRHAAEAALLFEARGWDDALAANTVRAYERYLERHAGGRHVAEARDKIRALQRDEALFEAALAKGTESALRRFLADYPGHAREPEALEALKDITEGQDIVDALGEKKIELRTEGNGIQKVRLRLRRLVPYTLTVRIPIGTYFVAGDRSAQNMVATAEARVTLTTGDWQSMAVSVACANRSRDIPGRDDTFTVQRSPNQAALAALMPVLDGERASYPVRQAAVWIVTDDADYQDLGILVSGYGGFGSRVIDQTDAARAMMHLEQAGIDLTTRAIWGDRDRILNDLPPGPVRDWLQEKG